jgi:hypothetical protein
VHNQGESKEQGE